MLYVHPGYKRFQTLNQPGVGGGPRRSLSLKLSETRVCEPQIRACLRLGAVGVLAVLAASAAEWARLGREQKSFM